MSRLLKIGEAAKLLGVSVQTLRRWETEKILLPRRDMREEATFTYQMRIEVDERGDQILREYAKLMGKVERSLLADIAAGKEAHKQKKSFMQRFQITARQFNASRVQIEGKIASIREKASQRIIDLKERIASLEKKIKRVAKSKKKEILHQKKRRLHCLSLRLQQVIEDKKQNKLRLCFGGRKRFRSQFALEANGYSSHQEWKRAWEEARDSSFFVLGSKDETAGNQTCTARISDNQICLRLRLPHFLADRYGKYLELPPITFAYGHQYLLEAVKACLEKRGGAICYR